MNTKRILVSAAVYTSFSVCVLAANSATVTLPRSTPEVQGISSEGILAFVKAADAQVDEMHSFMLVRHGHVVAEGWWGPYDAESQHVLFSLSKSFTSTAVGLAAAEGKLSVDDEVLKFFPDEAPAEPSNNLKAMRVRDLLCMSTGHQLEPRLNSTNEQTWTKSFLAQPVAHKPGTHFLYNTAATYMQSAIVQKVTGTPVLEYLGPRLFEPLGIEKPAWGTSPQGITLGGYGLSIRTEDIAKFGQLYLQKGQWHGRQLVPASWIEAATARQTSNGSNPKSDWDQGYGYQFWRCRFGNYRGDGAFGQFCIVLPEYDAVVAITSGTRDMQRVMNLVWDKLLPAIKTSALPANVEGEKELKQILASRTIRRPQGSASSSVVAKISGKQFVFPANDQKLESIQFGDGAGGGNTAVALRVNGVNYRFDSVHDTWRKGRLAYGGFNEQPAALSGAWASDDTYVAKLCFYETPTSVNVQMKFSEDQVQWDAEYNVAFGPTKQPQLIGRLP